MSRASTVANGVLRSPIGALARRRLGFHPERQLPRVAPRSFRQLVANRYGVRRVDVALFVDTFTNHLEPAIGVAALDYLDAAGASPAVAPNVCCGRTYLSVGLIEEARRLAAENVRRLLPLATAGVPIVGLEPSCILTLRDELLRLLPHDEEARAVARQACLWEDALDRWPTPHLTPITSPLVVHPHCHARAASDAAAPGDAVARIPGARVETLDAGCCGMAGAFGYRREHYALSVAIAQDRLIPSVRAQPDAAAHNCSTSPVSGPCTRLSFSPVTSCRAPAQAADVAAGLSGRSAATINNSVLSFRL
jgi:Fe-S oxidoreductase